MKNIFSGLYRALCILRADINRSAHDDRIIRALSAQNPTCRILSSALTNVVLGEHINIFEGVVLDKVNIKGFSYISHDSIVRNVDMGKFCSISSGVQIGLFRHPSRTFVSTYPAFYSNENEGCPMSFREDKVFDDNVPKTDVANDVWIGSNVIIPGGIKIGTGAIIAAGAVVVTDVPPYAVVAGNPASIKRYRFTDDQISQLLESRWWDWPITTIRQRAGDFVDIERFLERNGE